MISSISIRIGTFVTISTLLLILPDSKFALCRLLQHHSLPRVARETDNSLDMNSTEFNKTRGDLGGDGPLPATIYPPPTTIREVVGFTAETGSTGSPFLQVKASPPTTGAMTGSASTKPMIIVGSIMLAGCVGGGVYLWYLRQVKLEAEQHDMGGGGGEVMPMQAMETADAGPDPDDEEEDAIPEP